MRVFFYFDNLRKKNIDFSIPEKGNPGIGGTEFMIWMISYYLNLYFNDIEVSILAPVIDKLPSNIKCIKCDSIYNAVELANNMNSDVLVLRGAKYEDENLYKLIDEMKVKTIMWCHNFERYKYLKLASDTKYIKRNICVSKEQYDRLRDHKIFKKSDYIFNCIDCSIYENKIDVNQKENIVCYLGAIRPAKGFHKLAEVWERIEEKIPNCKLYVIGSGKLYDEDIILGKYGIAEKSYEDIFIKYLVDNNGKIKGNIKFFGDLSHNDKIEIMSQAKVGVLNPIAKDETFCISAIEFEALGVPVVAKKAYGLLNTVKNNQTGFLIKNDNQLVKYITMLLKDNSLNGNMGKKANNYINNNFDVKNICCKWREMLYEVKNNQECSINIKLENYSCDLKWLREINRKIKKIYVLKEIPAILEYPDVIYDNKYYKKASIIKSNILNNKQNIGNKMKGGYVYVA